MEQITAQLAEALISLLAILIATALVQLRARVLAWIDARKNVTERELLHHLAEEGFALIEQTMQGNLSGNKLQAATNYVSAKLKDRNINLEPDEIRAAIEKFVTEYNKQNKPA